MAALSGRLDRATEWAEGAADAISNGSDVLTEHIIPGAAVALAWVHLQRGDMREAHVQLKLAETALRTDPDKLVSALACAVAAQRGVAAGQARAAVEMIRRAREEWSASPPGWLEVRLAILESRAWTAAGDAAAAVAAAQRADSGPEATAALAHAWLAAGDEQAARRVLDTERPESAELGLALADARLSYGAGDGARGRRCLERALQLAKPERMKLPFAMERTWLRQVLRRDPELADAYRELLEPDVISPGLAPPAKKPSGPAQATPLVVERLSAREREVLAHASEMLSTAEIATEMYLSVNTVKTHLQEHLPQAVGDAPERGRPPRPATRVDLTNLVFHRCFTRRGWGAGAGWLVNWALT